MFYRISLLLFITFITISNVAADDHEDHQAIHDFMDTKFEDVGLTDEEKEDIAQIVQSNGMANLQKAETEVLEYASKFPKEKYDKLAEAIGRVKGEMQQLKDAFSKIFDNIAQAFSNVSEDDTDDSGDQNILESEDIEEDESEFHEEL